MSFLRELPTSQAAVAGLAPATDADRLALFGRDPFWWPALGVGHSELDQRALTAALGAMTTRTLGTVQNIVAKL